MKLIAALDISQGKVVRLRQGREKEAKIYGKNPQEFALRWEEEGADILHIVDLDAAWQKGSNLKVIEKIIKKVSLEVEVGGGLRSFAKISEVLNCGAQRAILGTRALDEDFLLQAVSKFKDRIAVSVDALGKNLAVEGWQEQTPINVLEMVKIARRLGIEWIIYTDISRDGMLKGPNLAMMKEIISLSGPHYILSGGVSLLSDLKKIKKELPGLFGVILGKALYEGKIKLKEAKKVFSRAG